MKIGTGIYLEKLNRNPVFYQETYDCLEIQDFVMPNNLDKNYDTLIRQYKTILKNYKGFLTIHGPYIDLHPTSFDPLVRDIAIQRYRQAFGAAVDLDPKFMVIHSDYEPVKAHEQGYEDYLLQQNTVLWQELAKELETHKIIAVIENVHNKDPHLIRNILHSIDSPYLGACLDTGHAHALGESDLTSWIKVLGGYLRYIHLHDNHGDLDQHLPLGEGNIDFEGLFRELREIQYDSAIICEIFGEPDVQQQNLRRLKAFIK